MEGINIIIILFFGILILLNLNEMRRLIISVKKRRIETIIVTLISIAILAFTFWYGEIWRHYLLGILLIMVLISFWTKRGLTKKGFNSMMSLAHFQRWDNIDYVEVKSNNDGLKVSYLASHLVGKESYYFPKKDYDKIINILLKNLSNEKVRVNQV